MTTLDDLKTLVMKAAHHLILGIPLKDVMEQGQVEEAISMLADVLYVTGTPQYNEDDEE